MIWRAGDIVLRQDRHPDGDVFWQALYHIVAAGENDDGSVWYDVIVYCFDCDGLDIKVDYIDDTFIGEDGTDRLGSWTIRKVG